MIVSLRAFQHPQTTVGKAQVWVALCAFQAKKRHKVAHVCRHYTNTHIRVCPNTLHSSLHSSNQSKHDRLIQSCASLIQQAASSYNNIALWRSPERTGKCCLCASAERGGVGLRGCLYSPNNRLRWVGRGEAKKKAGRRGWGGVQRGRCTPAHFTFGVNKVWTTARVNATGGIYVLYTGCTTNHVTWTTEEGEVERVRVRGTQHNVVKELENWRWHFFSQWK